MNPIKFKSQWGNEYDIIFVKETYNNNGRLYVGCWYYDEECGGYLPYCDVTVNLVRRGVLTENYGFIDINNADPDLIKLMYSKGWINPNGVVAEDGYPMVEFSEEFLKMLDTD